MGWRQTIAAALVIALACCAVMWALEDFRQRKMIADFKAALAEWPTSPAAEPSP
jgi:hypothetical protein